MGLEGKQDLRSTAQSLRAWEMKARKPKYGPDTSDDDGGDLSLLQKKSKKKKTTIVSAGSSDNESVDVEVEKKETELSETPKMIDDEKKKATGILHKALRIELDKKITPKGPLDVFGKPFRAGSSDVAYMASTAGKSLFEDDVFLQGIAKENETVKDWKLEEREIEQIEAELSKADLNLLVFRVFLYNKVGKIVADAKKAIEAGELYQSEPMEITPELARRLILETMDYVLLTSHTEKDFLEARSNHSKAHLIDEQVKEIGDLINRSLGDAIGINEPIKISINKPKTKAPKVAPMIKPEAVVVDNELKQVSSHVSEDNEHKDVEKDPGDNIGKNGIINLEISSTSSAEEDSTTSKKNFELPKEQQEVFEDNLIKAIHSIKEIVADDHDIDFHPVEKHFSGNLKEKMESLLNRGGLIGEDSDSAGAEEYRKELGELNELAREIIELEKNGQVCVIHEGSTYYMNKKQEITLQELEKTVKNVVGEKYLSAFIFGIKGDYKKYVSALQDNPKWTELSDGDKCELLEKGVAYFVDETLDENENLVNDEVREKIYKYAFTILNK